MSYQYQSCAPKCQKPKPPCPSSGDGCCLLPLVGVALIGAALYAFCSNSKTEKCTTFNNLASITTTIGPLAVVSTTLGPVITTALFTSSIPQFSQNFVLQTGGTTIITETAGTYAVYAGFSAETASRTTTSTFSNISTTTALYVNGVATPLGAAQTGTAASGTSISITAPSAQIGSVTLAVGDALQLQFSTALTGAFVVSDTINILISGVYLTLKLQSAY